MKRSLLLLFLVLVAATAHARDRLRLATTTSTENSGLLAVLHPPFEERFDARVDVIAVGTGKALKLGENGDVDVVMVHAPGAEEAFVAQGFGVERVPLMHNDFVLLGPPADPAVLGNAAALAEAMSGIAGSGAGFVSRGDDSGTHKKELELWERAGIEPSGKWYLAVGQGMGAVLTIADDKQAYTLADRGTFLAYAGRIDLVIVYDGAEELRNPYHVIMVNPERHPHVKADLVRRYIEYLTGETGQAIIRNYRTGGKPLFFPDVID